MFGLDTLATAILASLLFGFLVYRQCTRRPVTQKDFILPALGALYLGLRAQYGVTGIEAVIVEVSAVLGIASGFAAGSMVRVWRDAETGRAYQFGGWRYGVVLVGLVGVRVLWHVVTGGTGLAASVAALNDAFIALSLGNYFGRSVHVALRAFHLVGWNPRAIPTRRQIK